MTIDPVFLDTLEAKAKAATQGPWGFWAPKQHGAADNPSMAGPIAPYGPRWVQADHMVGLDPTDAAYIVAVEPQIGLELVHEIKRLRATDAAVRRAAAAAGMTTAETAAGYDCAAFLIYEIDRLKRSL